MSFERVSESRPILLMFSALVCLLFSYLLTPDLLISLGPMSNSLTSEIESVRDLALLEIKLAKVMLAVCGIFLAGLFLFWRSFRTSNIYSSIADHDYYRSHDHELFSSSFFNRSSILIFLSLLAGLIYIHFGADLFSLAELDYFNREDGPLESVSALLFLSLSLLTLFLAYKFYRENLTLRFLMCALLAVIYFVMFGEEISWGQRLFSIETPEYFLENNVQQEINLHNLYGYIFDHIFIAALLAWGTLCPLLANFSRFFRNFFDIVGLPIASAGLAVGFLLVTLFQAGFVYQVLTPLPGLRIEELRELLSAIALLLLMSESFLFFR